MKEVTSRRRYSPEFKQDAIKLAENIGVGEAANKLNIALSSLQRWKCQKNIPIEKSQDVVKLQREVKRLKKELTEEKAIVEMLKKSHSFFFKRKRKMIYQFITENRGKNLSLKKACRVFSVSSSGYFKTMKCTKQQVQNKKREEEVVRAFKLHKGRYGYRKVSHYLTRRREFPCSLSQARHALKEYGLKARKAKSFKPTTTQSDKSCSAMGRVFKSGQTVLSSVNQVWGSDITYLKVIGGSFLYLAIFLDFYSRRIVGWEVSHSLSSGVVLRAFYGALKTRSVKEGLIVHSDRGVQYTAGEFRKQLKELGFVQSLSRRGNCYDHAYCESCFSLLKRELGHKVYVSLSEAREDVFEWIEGWYNTHRLHSALGYRSPMEFEKQDLTWRKKTS